MTKKQFVVVGLGHFGASVATTLYRIGANVLAIDADAERVEEVRDMVTHAVQASGVNREALIQLGVRDFDIAVVAIGGEGDGANAVHSAELYLDEVKGQVY